MLEITKCKRLLIPRKSTNMAVRADTVQSAKSKVRLGTKKEIVLYKTKKLYPNGLYHVAPITVGTSSCTKCENVNKENMIECRWCLRWFHHTCESLDLFQLEFLTKTNIKFPTRA